MQYHFVVMYDESTDKFLVDTRTTDAKFNSYLAFDSQTNDWYTLDELMQADYVDYENLLADKLDGIY